MVAFCGQNDWHSVNFHTIKSMEDNNWLSMLSIPHTATAFNKNLRLSGKWHSFIISISLLYSTWTGGTDNVRASWTFLFPGIWQVEMSQTLTSSHNIIITQGTEWSSVLCNQGLKYIATWLSSLGCEAKHWSSGCYFVWWRNMDGHRGTEKVCCL